MSEEEIYERNKGLDAEKAIQDTFTSDPSRVEGSDGRIPSTLSDSP